MSRPLYSSLQPPSTHPPRDSLELASLASSDGRSPSSSRSSSPPGISSSRKQSLENEDPLSSSNAAAAGRPGHGRSYSVSSAFDFATSLFPLSTTAGGYAPVGTPGAASLTDPFATINGGTLERHKTLTYLNGLSLIVGMIIGSGIFSSPGEVNSHIGSLGASLIVWTFCGILAWTGAASYAELGGAIPLNGGAQVYLAKIFGEMVGFLFTWCAVCVMKPGAAAIISIIFAEYIVRAVVGADAQDVSPWINKGVALAGLFLVTLLNCLSTKLATRVTDFFMFFKFIALLGVAVTGIVVAVTGYSWRGDASTAWRDQGWFEGTNTDVSDWAVAVYAALWAYDGWDNVNYVAGEFINPQRDLSRVIHTAMPIVIFFYLLANVAYFLVLPFAVIAASNTVAVQFGSKVFGPIGALVLALVVSVSCFGASNAGTFMTSRLIYAAGKEGYLPSIFGQLGISTRQDSINTRLRTRSWATKRMSKFFGDDGFGLGFTPIYAMILSAILTAIYIILGEFGTLITFSGVAAYSFYFLTVLGLIILRVKEPELERPYKTWITTPIIFCCVSLFLVSRSLFAQPLQAIIVVGFVILGIPVYYWRVSGRNKEMSRHAESAGPWWKFWKRWGRR